MLAKYCEVDLGSYLGHKKDRQVIHLWMCWLHVMMGMVLSPYAAIQGMLWASEVVREYRSDLDNPLMWENIRLNLPGDLSYSPTIPWMSKFRGGLTTWPQILPPMWMNPEWLQGQQKRRGGQH